jgi:hypothetical protein
MAKPSITHMDAQISGRFLESQVSRSVNNFEQVQITVGN